jgi:DNA-binding NarL/FixJ family response regulator
VAAIPERGSEPDKRRLPWHARSASPGSKAAMPTTYQNAWRPPVTNVVTLLLADQHVLVAEGLEMLLAAEDDLEILGLAHHSGQAIELAAKHQPTVLVLDAELPNRDLEETLATVRAAAPATRLLVLAGDFHPSTTAAVLAVGADGCLAKDRSSRQVAAAVRKLAAGESAIMAAAARTPGRDPSVELLVGTLAFREREILGLLTGGLTTRRIAQAPGPLPESATVPSAGVLNPALLPRPSSTERPLALRRRGAASPPLPGDLAPWMGERFVAWLADRRGCSWVAAAQSPRTAYATVTACSPAAFFHWSIDSSRRSGGQSKCRLSCRIPTTRRAGAGLYACLDCGHRVEQSGGPGDEPGARQGWLGGRLRHR